MTLLLFNNDKVLLELELYYGQHSQMPFYERQQYSISLIQVNKPLICNTKEEKSLSTACKTNLMLYEYLIHFKSWVINVSKILQHLTALKLVYTYIAKNATDLLQVVNFTSLLPLVNKLQQACQFHQVQTSLLRSGLLQLVICRLVTVC